MGACGARRANKAARWAWTRGVFGGFGPMLASKAYRAVLDSRSTAPGSSPLLSERFRRPISPLHTAAFQVGWILQVSSVATLSFSPSLSMTWELGMPVTDPSKSWNDRVRYALPPRLSLSNLRSYFGK